MKLKAKSIAIPDGDPFKHDALSRRPAIEFLTDLVLAVETPYVLCVDSPWGTGKSTFLQLWKAHLQSKEQPVLYFNAWSTDFAADPLLAFVSEISEYISETAPEEEKKKAQRIDRLKKMASSIARGALPAAGKLATAGILDLDKFSESVLAGLVETTIQSSVDAYLAEKGIIEKFHTEIEGAIGTLSEGGEPARLIIFVDELDRCRPKYAIELLERIKHLFNVENVVFVLALDKAQLCVSLSAVYGTGFNGSEYLRRFVDLEFSLPSPNTEKFTERLLDQFSFDEFFVLRTQGELRYDRENFLKIFNGLCDLFAVSLRAREQMMARLRLAAYGLKENHYLHPYVIVTLVFLREFAPEVFRRFVGDSGRVSELIEYLESQSGGSEFLHTHFGTVLEFEFLRSKLGAEGLPELESYKVLAVDEGADEAERERAQFILKLFKDHGRRHGAPNLKFLVSKIELAAQVER